jgi:uncharacterized Ntn-hydrolase superfamily protein
MPDFPSERLAATYSIVARDAETGALGVGVQSNYFSVGTRVSWAAPGIGAIATQSIIEISYGPRGLDLLSRGATAEEALERLVAEDPGAALRQVGIVDASGRVAAHTGGVCVPACAHQLGNGFSVQGNMLEAVWQAMGPAFESAKGDLADRLLAALDAAEAEGGDVRGGRSAALIVVDGRTPERSWEGRHVDLHVEDDAHPLVELRRLLTLRRANDLFEQARAVFGEGDLEGALDLVTRAQDLHPDVQFAFWTGVALANAGRDEEARSWLGQAFGASTAWRELARRLCDVGIYSGSRDLIES